MKLPYHPEPQERKQFLARFRHPLFGWVQLLTMTFFILQPLTSTRAVYVPNADFQPYWLPTAGDSAPAGGPNTGDDNSDGLPNWWDDFQAALSVGTIAWWGGHDATIDGVFVTVPGQYHNASVGDSDGDGIPDDLDPYPYDGNNNSFYWAGGTYYFNGSQGSAAYPLSFSPQYYAGTWSDRDGDGIPDFLDPLPDDAQNGNQDTAGGGGGGNDTYDWSGGTFLIDGVQTALGGGTYSGSWNDMDGDGIPDAADPYPSDYYNNTVWWEGDTFMIDGVSITLVGQNHSASAGDYDTDGIPDDLDPYPADPTNHSFWWGGGNFTVDNSAVTYNNQWYAGSGADSDGDGIPDGVDPYPTDANNGNSTTGGGGDPGTWWYGGTFLIEGSYSTFAGQFYSGSPSDTDNDGIPDVLDPYPSDPWNGTSFTWGGGAYVIDGVPTLLHGGTYGGLWSDQDGDGIPDVADPHPTDFDNNCALWPGGTFIIDAVWRVFPPMACNGIAGDQDNDGIPDDLDPYPSDSSNNSFYWGGGDYMIGGNSVHFAAQYYAGSWNDADSDGIPDLVDPFPYDSGNADPYAGQTWWPGGPFLIDGILQNVVGGYYVIAGDADNDGIPDAFDRYPNDPYNNSYYQWAGGTFKIGNKDVPLPAGLYPTPWSDRDHDGIPDFLDPYPDDFYNNNDTDGDGIPDSVEVAYGLNPDSADDAGQPRHCGDVYDGLTWLQAYQYGVMDVCLKEVDSDQDGMSDAYEIIHGLNRFDARDALECPLGDFIFNFEKARLGLAYGPLTPISPLNYTAVTGRDLGEVIARNDPQKSPAENDWDGDGISNRDEILVFGTNCGAPSSAPVPVLLLQFINEQQASATTLMNFAWLKTAANSKILPDYWLNAYGLPAGSSGDADYDNDGVSNWNEFLQGSNPNDTQSTPDNPGSTPPPNYQPPSIPDDNGNNPSGATAFKRQVISLGGGYTPPTYHAGFDITTTKEEKDNTNTASHSASSQEYYNLLASEPYDSNTKSGWKADSFTSYEEATGAQDEQLNAVYATYFDWSLTHYTSQEVTFHIDEGGSLESQFADYTVWKPGGNTVLQTVQAMEQMLAAGQEPHYSGNPGDSMAFNSLSEAARVATDAKTSTVDYALPEISVSANCSASGYGYGQHQLLWAQAPDKVSQDAAYTWIASSQTLTLGDDGNTTASTPQYATVTLTIEKGHQISTRTTINGNAQWLGKTYGDGTLSMEPPIPTSDKITQLVTLTPLEIKAHPIRSDGSISLGTDTIRASTPSPIIDVTSCPIQNAHIEQDGGIYGDIHVSGTIKSAVCDTIPGDDGKIETMQLFVNNAEDSQASITVSAHKESNGSAGKPYPYSGTFDQVIQHVPLAEGNNVLSFQARDKIYNIAGYHVWTASVTLSDPGDGDGSPAGVQVTVSLSSSTVNGQTINLATLDYSDTVNTVTGVMLVEVEPGSGIFANEDGCVVQLSDLATLSSQKRDTLSALVQVQTGGAVVPLNLTESTSSSGIFTGGYSTTPGGGDPNNPTDPNDPIDPDQPQDPTVQAETPYSFDQSNGGEFFSYALEVSVPLEFADSVSLKMGDETAALKWDPLSGKVLMQSSQDSSKNAAVSFRTTEPLGDDGSPDDLDDADKKAHDDLKDASFTEGFFRGMGAGGVEMVGGTLKVVKGAASYLGRGLLCAALEVTIVGQWAVGANTEGTSQFLVEVGEPNLQVHEDIVKTAKMMEPLANWVAANQDALTDKIAALITKDDSFMDNPEALHASEMNDAVVDVAAEVIVGMLKDHANDTSGQRGYLVGRITFEAVSLLIPFTKVGKLAQIKKGELLAKLLNKSICKGLSSKTALTALSDALKITKMCFVAGTKVHASTGLKNIEDIHAGDVVWSRDEFSGEQAWRPVVETFVTHPTELHHLTYTVRGPPEEATKSETLGVTGPHPFWVCNREKAGFVPAEDLRAGDVLSLADGRTAEVAAKTIESAPDGQTFTTYNFEVAQFHTYFVGEAGVWVHNLSTRSACEKAFSIFNGILKKEGGDVWKAYSKAMTKYPKTLEEEVQLRVFNEARHTYLTSNVGGTPALWEDLGKQSLGHGGSPEILGKNLEAIGIKRPGDATVAAHHIVPHGVNDPRVDHARAILSQAGIDIDEAANGVFLPRTNVLTLEHPELGSPHASIHSDTYYQALEARLATANPQKIRFELQKIADELVQGTFPW